MQRTKKKKPSNFKKRGTIRKKIRGGADSKFLVFYVCFFGMDDNVANKVPEMPSSTYDCFYFSNNKATLEKLKGTTWKPVFVDKPIKTNALVRNSAMDSKELKACPHHFKELNGYKYQCYYDTKILEVKDTDIEQYIKDLMENKTQVMMVNMHEMMMNKSNKPSVWGEYNEAMKQSRYQVNSDKYKRYIEKQVSKGYKNTQDNHYETSLIIRKTGDKVNEIGEEWYKHIQETGIECQISFFFIQQMFNDYIIPTPRQYLRVPRQGGGRKGRYRGGNPADHKYIILDLMTKEGLGNQMYVFAAGIMLKKKLSMELCMIPSIDNPHSKRDYTKIFGVKLTTELGISQERINAAADPLPELSSPIQKWGPDNIKYDAAPGTIDVKVKYMNFQNYASIHDAIPEVKDAFMKNEFSQDKYKEIEKSINSSESAFMHIRRGDYLEYQWDLKEEYYLKALDTIEKNPAIKTIYLFSNEMPWCETNMAKLKEHTTKNIICDTTTDELEVLYKMSLCTAGAIIANSTFSSWGAYMGADMNPNSTIVYSLLSPQYHDAPNPHNFPERWNGI